MNITSSFIPQSWSSSVVSLGAITVLLKLLTVAVKAALTYFVKETVTQQSKKYLKKRRKFKLSLLRRRKPDETAPAAAEGGTSAENQADSKDENQQGATVFAKTAAAAVISAPLSLFSFQIKHSPVVVIQSKLRDYYSTAAVSKIDGSNSAANDDEESTVFILPAQGAEKEVRSMRELREALANDGTCVDPHGNRSVWSVPVCSVSVLQTLLQISLKPVTCCCNADNVYTWTLMQDNTKTKEKDDDESSDDDGDTGDENTHSSHSTKMREIGRLQLTTEKDETVVDADDSPNRKGRKDDNNHLLRRSPRRSAEEHRNDADKTQ